MYNKEFKASFRKFVNRQAMIAAMIDDIYSCMWHCLYYFSGLNDAIYIAGRYDSYMTPFLYENFKYIFRSIVEYRKGVH